MRIYKATNIENGKVYIGQTTQPFEVRRAQHEYGHGAFYFGNALKKYDFDWEIVKECSSIDELNTMEEYFIKKYKSNIKEFGYNLKSGGENSLVSKRSRKKMSIAKQNMSEETKEKIRQSRIGKKHKPETIEKFKNRTIPMEVRKRIGETQIGKKLSEKTRNKMSDTRKKTYNTPKMHKVLSESAKRGWETRRRNAEA
jgi:group I intron endonuclease